MAPPSPDPWLSVASVVRPHGIRGEVVCDILTDFPQRLEPGTTLHLRAPGTAAPARTIVIETARPHDGRMLLRLAGCATRNDAETLRGHDLVIPAAERRTDDPGAIHLADLLGATLYDRATATDAGEITGLDRESSNLDLLVVRSPSRRELLVPLAKAYAPHWEPASRRLSMTLPDGLLTLEDAPSASA